MRKDIDFDQVRKLLDTEKTKIQQRLDEEMKLLLAHSDLHPINPNITKTIAHGRRIGWINYLQGRQTQIEEATRRLETGQYGICTNCGNDMDLERLKVKPYSKFCAKCKKKNDQRKR